MVDGMSHGSHWQASKGVGALQLVLSSLCLISSVWCHAEQLTDPTRPPASIAVPDAESNVEADKKAIGLQSVFISKNHRAAIIDGQMIALGGKLGEATLVEVSESCVVLKTPKGREILTLFPDVKITNAAAQRTHHPVTCGEKK